MEGLAFSVIPTRSSRLDLVSDCSRASQSPLGRQNLMWEWERGAVLVKYRLVLAARTSFDRISPEHLPDGIETPELTLEV